MKIEDTGNNAKQPAWFALQDIEARAAAAYARHKALFDSESHRALCDSVEQILKSNATVWTGLYQTARAATRKQAAHTEVKINRAMFATGGLPAIEAAVTALGIDADDITYKPKTQSLSVRVK